ncbi:phosphoglucomutase-2 [Drosophila busckii]|nr:phosphoglucomutase-2 [Drosophila busckii]
MCINLLLKWTGVLKIINASRKSLNLLEFLKPCNIATCHAARSLQSCSNHEGKAAQRSELAAKKYLDLTPDKELNQQLTNWIYWDRNPQTMQQIVDAVDCEAWDWLRSRLCQRMQFGTAGLRGEMRAGFDSMNDLVVLQTSQGLCAYIKQQCEQNERSVVIGYDGRHHSKRFAELAATVFLSNQFRVHLFGRTVATPFIPFAVKKLNCLAGVMVTASHNPKQYNGFKLYWTNGAQIVASDEQLIEQNIMQHLEPQESSWQLCSLIGNDLLSDPYEQVVPAYIAALQDEFTCPMLQLNHESHTKIVYTAMQGVGYPYIKLAFMAIQLQPVIPVEQQVQPDPVFSTTPLPNPEEGKVALNLAIQTATEHESNLILANDPDADRLAVAELNEQGKFHIFTGNELGALLGWWVLQSFKQRMPNGKLSNCSMLASTVSSKILKSMAAVEGFSFHETLTGFKWMANMAIELQRQGRTVLFGFEEAIGFMIGTKVLDKDGISAAAHVASMYTYLHEKKYMSLQEQLHEIYDTYGYHASIGSYLLCKDQQIICKIFTRLRSFDAGQQATYPKSILNGEYKISQVRDLTTGYDSSTPNKKPVLPVTPSTQMITFTFENGLVATLRTSGTEPKLKYYAEICGKPEYKKWSELKSTLKRMTAAIVDEFYEPKRYGLEPKPVE